MSRSADGLTLTSKRTPAAEGELRKGVLVGAVLLAIGLWLVRFYHPLVFEQPLPLLKGTHGINVYLNPMKGWTISFPGSWHPRTFIKSERSGYQRSSWIELTNLGHPFPEDSMGVGMDPRLVALRVGYWAPGRHFVVTCRIDTTVPLNLKGSNQRRRIPILDGSGGRVTHLFKAFSKDGEPFNAVSVWIGSRASAADVRTMETIVESVSYLPTGDRRYGDADCSDGVPGW